MSNDNPLIELSEFQEVYDRLLALKAKHLASFPTETTAKRSARGTYTLILKAFQKLPSK